MAGKRHQKKVITEATAEVLDMPRSPCTWEGRDGRVSALNRYAREVVPAGRAQPTEAMDEVALDQLREILVVWTEGSCSWLKRLLEPCLAGPQGSDFGSRLVY